MKRLLKLLIPCLLYTHIQTTRALTPQEIKKTTLIGQTIPENIKNGIARGMTYIETNIIENMTRYAPKGAIKDLLLQLFNTITPTEFRVTDNSKYFGKYLTMQYIAQVTGVTHLDKVVSEWAHPAKDRVVF